MKTCPTHKKIYDTNELAEEALIAAWITYRLNNSNGPKSVYRCSDCGGYHLTSKGQINKRLEEYIASGKIDKAREANVWLDKLKGKGNY